MFRVNKANIMPTTTELEFEFLDRYYDVAEVISDTVRHIKLNN